MPSSQIIGLTILGVLLLTGIIAGTVGSQYSLNRIKRKTVGDGQYGSARFAYESEIRQSTIRIPYDPVKWRQNVNRPTEPGIIINLEKRGKRCFAYVDPTDNHVLMVAGPGGGKTTTFMFPNIEYALACGLSFTCTDSKGDILRTYGKLCAQYGYTCVNINFRFPTTSDPYNFLMLVNRYIDRWKSSGNVSHKSRAERKKPCALHNPHERL